LIFAAKLKSTGVVHPAVPKLRPDVMAEADGRYKVEIKATVTQGLLDAIQAAGGKIISSFPDYHVLQAALPVEKLESIAARDDVVFIRPPPKARQNYLDSEGDTTHQAITARPDYGVYGDGVTVGILSDSIDNGSNALANAISSGNIDPNNTFVIPGQAGTGEGEGLAMCEIVHDLAPDATIYFATGAAGEAQMASNIIALANAGCTIIADDEAYDDESPFQDQVIAQAIQTVTSNGILYFSSARNSGNLDAYINSGIASSSTWEGDFTGLGPYETDKGYEYWNNFAAQASQTASEDAIDVGGYDFEVDLFWSDPLGGSTNDYDLYMLDDFGDITYSSENIQDGTQDPYEHIDDTAQYSSGYYLVITLYSGVSRFMYMGFGRGALYWATSGCTKGHNACDAVNSFAVAATPAAAAQNAGDPSGPFPEPFNNQDIVETFSADGPRRMFYYSDGTPITPGNFSKTGGTVLYKPDLTAADGVSTTPPGFAPFFGTSAAAPHAAAIAALVWSYNPSLTPDQVRTILTNSCIDIMAPGWDRDSGNGILMANLALSNTPPPVVATSHLVFTTQPGGGTAGTAWTTQPVVTLEDGSGQTVKGTPQNVTLAIQNNAGPGGTLSGNVTVATVAGVATFTGLSIDKVGIGYTLTATGSTIDTTPGTVVSGSFNITAAAASAPTPSVVLSGGAVLLTWPATATGFTLQSTKALGSSAAWTAVSPGPIVIGGQNLVTIIPSGTQQFFRLAN
jgi:subtilisin family serine protease